jgi:hypothetical protein
VSKGRRETKNIRGVKGMYYWESSVVKGEEQNVEQKKMALRELIKARSQIWVIMFQGADALGFE